ncbi:MAG: hypothetical protein NT001_03735 [Candidatus Woesearchaeota archaeon]|nr:hypothetical protein [Candidatus Woesearchaeota archaeon]
MSTPEPTGKTFIPYETDGIRACIQIPRGEEYIIGQHGIFIVTGMDMPTIESLLGNHGEEYQSPRQNQDHDIVSILPSGASYTGADVQIFGLNGAPIIQYNRTGEVINGSKRVWSDKFSERTRKSV